jgi:uncharacterized protein with PhoU and TrkA domain
MELMLAARDAEDAESLAGVSRVALAADKISDAAADIAAIVTQKIGVHRIVSEVFEKVEERLIRSMVSRASVLINQKIGDLDLAARMGVDIIAIRRNKDWILDPKDEESIVQGDVLIARGAPDGVKEFKALVEGELQELGD